MQVQAVSPAMMASASPSHSIAIPTTNRPLAIHTAATDAASTLLAISPENDPHPSWTFFPPSATYIPHTPSSPSSSSFHVSNTSPSSSSLPRRLSPPLAPASTINTLRNLSINSSSSSNKNNIPSSTPSTHHRILDHCFHLSIETRLKQAEAQYLASIQEQAVEQQIEEQEERHQTPMSVLHQDVWRRRQRTLVDEAVVLGRKGSNVEAIVDGILKSHRSSGPLQTLPRHLKHRLHLCQLTSMVFGRFDVASSTNNSAGLNIYSAFHLRRHRASRAAVQRHLTNNPQGQKTRVFFSKSIHSSLYCRRHHRKDCQRTCCTLAKLQHQQQLALEQKKQMMMNSHYHNNSNNTNSNNNSNNHQGRKPEQQRVAGLVDAIPAFLKCSAMSYRDIAKCMVEKGEAQEASGSRVLDGWYRLLLEMMTQAVIESYLCDGTAGVETILDVFSYGDDSDAEEDVKDSTIVAEESANGSPVSVESLQFQKHHLQQQQQQQQDTMTQEGQDDTLFAKSAEYDAFKKAKDERLQEFLNWQGTSMEAHFVKLAAKYPLIVFERQMTHYISRSQKLLVDPKLSRSAEEIGLLIPPATSAYADGSLSMPVSDDEDDEEMEEVVRLEEIKEEEEDVPPIQITPEPRQQQQKQEKRVQRHEKMKLATITISMDEDPSPPGTQVQNKNKPKQTRANPKSKTKDSKAAVSTATIGRERHHLPSPPPSVAASRSSTVSPSTSTASLSEEDESIAEAARILISNGSGSKKHKYADIKTELQDEVVVTKRVKV